MWVFASPHGAGKVARMRTFLSLLFSLLFVAGACARDITAAQPTLPTTPMIIDTVKGANRFTVEMALTWDQQEIGLMFRRTLAPNAGMLFDFVRESNQAFWMKNTSRALHRTVSRSRKIRFRRTSRCARCWRFRADAQPSSA
jgi:hypothetical protein